MWHSPLNGIGRRMVPFAIYSLPDSRVKCLSPLVGVPVIAHQQRLTFSCSSPFRCSHLTLSSSLFLIHSPYIVSLQYPLLCSICTRSLFILFFSRWDKSAAASAQLVPSAIIHLERARRKGETTGVKSCNYPYFSFLFSIIWNSVTWKKRINWWWFGGGGRHMPFQSHTSHRTYTWHVPLPHCMVLLVSRTCTL